MKKTLLLITAASFTGLSAQTLTQATHEPVVNDKEYIMNLDTSAFSSGLLHNTNGAGSVWDFSAATPATGNTLTNSYDAPGTYTHGTLFSGATVVQNLIGNMFNYFKSSTNQAEVVGIYTSSLAMTFTNSAIVVQYPMSLNSTVGDAVAGTFTMGSFNGPLTGTTQTIADGTGTLMLANGVTYNNVIRIKTVQNFSLSAGFVTGNVDQTIYNYYDGAKKFPIINVSYIRLATSVSGPTVIAGMFGAAEAYTVVGMAENQTGISGVFPNPANDLVTIDLADATAGGTIAIYNLAGQKVVALDVNKAGQYTSIDVSSLTAGIYTLRVEGAKATLNRKLVIAR